MLALTAALGAAPAMAQEAPADEVSMDLLLELAANNAVDDVLNLPGAELGAVLAAASDDQVAQLVSALSPAQAESLVASVAQSGTGAANVAKVVMAVITADPGLAERIVNVVRANTAPVALPQVADAMVSRVDRCLADLPAEGSASLVSGIVSLNTGSAGPLVEKCDCQGDAGDAIIRQLAIISETADPDVADAIESAVQQSTCSLQVFAEARGEIAPAAVEPDPVQAAEAPPAATPPADIGGGGATPGDTPASVTGGDPSSGGGGGGTSPGGATPSPGGGSTPPGGPVPVSPTN
ncbi:MAG: hypothetical protein GVY34_13290 [Alphaproteobacteria bacterium]|nr:hypothetical protein [Alphaproteobacteria bacterium]